MKYFILTVIICAVIFLIYLYWENKKVLVTRHENFGGDVKIMHISDSHKRNNSRYNSRIVKAAASGSPDIIFITGDLISRTETDFSESEKLLRSLCGIAPVYMCMGNHEQSLPESLIPEFIEALERTEVRLLVNEGEYAEIRGRKFYICGIQQEYSVYKKDGKYKDLDGFEYEQMERLAGKCPQCETLLLAHNPFFGEVYAEWGAKYTFSGHVHGGIVRIFGVGLLSPERKFLPKYSKGVYTIGKMKLLVSAGIGKLRIFDPPEIIFYTI